MIELTGISTEELNAELESRRKAEEAQKRKRIGELKAEIAKLESELGGIRIRGPRLHVSPLMNPAEVQNAVLKAFDASVAPLSMAKVVQVTGLGQAAVKRALAALIESGALIQRGNRRSSVYVIQEGAPAAAGASPG